MGITELLWSGRLESACMHALADVIECAHMRGEIIERKVKTPKAATKNTNTKHLHLLAS